MKKTAIYTASLAMIAGAFMASSAMADSNKMVFSGTITDSSCVIDTSTSDLSLPELNASALQKIGDSGPEKDVTVNFVSCPTAKNTMNIVFDGGTVITLPDGRMLIDNDETRQGSAKNVGMTFKSDSIKNNSLHTTITNGKATINGKLAFYAEQSNVVAGTFYKELSYTITYS